MLNKLIEYIDFQSNLNIDDIPFVQYIIQVLSVLVVIYLYCYLFFAYKFNTKVILITFIFAIIHLFIHIFIYTYNTINVHDFSNFPIFYFIYSLLYFVPFYFITYVLLRKKNIVNRK